jgi:hypothetical protein
MNTLELFIFIFPSCLEYRLNDDEINFDSTSLTVFTLKKSFSLKMGLFCPSVSNFYCFFLLTIDALLNDFLKLLSFMLLLIAFYRLYPIILELVAVSMMLTPI